MIQTETKPWQHDLDAKKYLLDVHMAFKKYLGVDFKLARLNDKEREFIFTMVPAALGIYDLCPNKQIAEEIMNMDMAYVNTLAILKFNVDNNMIVNRLTQFEPPQTDEEEDTSFIERIKKRINGESKPKQVNADED